VCSDSERARRVNGLFKLENEIADDTLKLLLSDAAGSRPALLLWTSTSEVTTEHY
jgi:hypothetical protein